MNIIKWVMQWFERRRARRELLATPGVDLLVQRVMDERYGKHGWRVRDGYLEASVQSWGQGASWWGTIGLLHDPNTRNWLRAGGRPAEVSHAKEAPYKIEPPTEEGYYGRYYADTEPLDDDGRTSK